MTVSDYSCFSRPPWFVPKPMSAYNAWVTPPSAVARADSRRPGDRRFVYQRLPDLVHRSPLGVLSSGCRPRSLRFSRRPQQLSPYRVHLGQTVGDESPSVRCSISCDGGGASGHIDRRIPLVDENPPREGPSNAAHVWPLLAAKKGAGIDPKLVTRRVAIAFGAFDDAPEQFGYGERDRLVSLALSLCVLRRRDFCARAVRR